MKNSNDNLKEKEIKTEAALKENELESVSGGRFWGLGNNYQVDTNICKDNKCKMAACQMRCCHPTAICVKNYEIITREYGDFYGTDGYIDWHYKYYYAKIDTSLCEGCRNCDAQKACLYNAIKQV